MPKTEGIGQRAFMLITGTWSFPLLKKVLTFMATAIETRAIAGNASLYLKSVKLWWIHFTEER